MDDLRTYLSLPSSQQLYSAGLQLFERYAMARYSHQHQRLAAGPFVGNKEILLQCLNDIYKQPPKTAPARPVIQVEAPKQAAQLPTNKEEINLALELRQLRLQRMQTSQQFHSCAEGSEGDAARALICDQIERITKQIKDTEYKLSYLQQYNHLPPEDDEQLTFPEIPDTVEACGQEKTRLSSWILKIEKRIVYLLSLPENSSKRKAQLPVQQNKLHQLVVHREAVRIRQLQLKNENEEEE